MERTHKVEGSKIHDPFLAIGMALHGNKVMSVMGWKRFTISCFGKSYAPSGDYEATPFTESEIRAFKSLKETAIEVTGIGEGSHETVKIPVLHGLRTTAPLLSNVSGQSNWFYLDKSFTAAEALSGFVKYPLVVDADGTTVHKEDCRRAICYVPMFDKRGQLCILGCDVVDFDDNYVNIGAFKARYGTSFDKEQKVSLFLKEELARKYLQLEVSNSDDDSITAVSDDNFSRLKQSFLDNCHKFRAKDRNGRLVTAPIYVAQSTAMFDGREIAYESYTKALMMCAAAECNDERASLFAAYTREGYLTIDLTLDNEHYVLSTESEQLFKSLCRYNASFLDSFIINRDKGKYQFTYTMNDFVLETPAGKLLKVSNSKSYEPICAALSISEVMSSKDGYLPSILDHLYNIVALYESNVLTSDENGVLLGNGEFQGKDLYLRDGLHKSVTRKQVTREDMKDGVLYLASYRASENNQHYVSVIPYEGRLVVAYNPYLRGTVNTFASEFSAKDPVFYAITEKE